VRWEALFADLEAQASAADRAELEAEVDDRSRHELAGIRLLDRVRAAAEAGARVTVAVVAGAPLTGRVSRVGADWLLLADTGAGDALVPAHAVVGVVGLGRAADPGSRQAVSSRLSLGFALRAVARDRSPVTVLAVDGSVTGGTVDGVGADFVELGAPAPAPRRAIALAALVWLRSAG
jgi:hypothetical protein